LAFSTSSNRGSEEIMSRRPLFALACLLLPAVALADAEAPVGGETLHPLGALPTLGTSGGGAALGLDRFQWGPTTLSYSQSWGGGQSRSLGMLTRDLRVPLGGNLDFNTRFGVAFTPNAGLSGQEQAGQFVLPYAALDWRPTESFLLHVEVGQGLGHSLYDPFAPLGWQRDGLLSPRGDTVADRVDD
jgi:hypothetical protein